MRNIIVTLGMSMGTLFNSVQELASVRFYIHTIENASGKLKLLQPKTCQLHSTLSVYCIPLGPGRPEYICC